MRKKVGKFTFGIMPATDGAHHEVLVSEDMGLYSAYVNLAEDPRFLLFGVPDPPGPPPGLEEEYRVWTWRRGQRRKGEWDIAQPLWRLSEKSLNEMMAKAAT